MFLLVAVSISISIVIITTTVAYTILWQQQQRRRRWRRWRRRRYWRYGDDLVSTLIPFHCWIPHRPLCGTVMMIHLSSYMYCQILIWINSPITWMTTNNVSCNRYSAVLSLSLDLVFCCSDEVKYSFLCCYQLCSWVDFAFRFFDSTHFLHYSRHGPWAIVCRSGRLCFKLRLTGEGEPNI